MHALCAITAGQIRPEAGKTHDPLATGATLSSNGPGVRRHRPLAGCRVMGLNGALVRRTRRLGPILAGALVLGSGPAGCRDGGLTGRLAEPPSPTPPGQAKCMIASSQLRPLIVEWQAADRAALEVRLRKQGLVAVRYAGCEMEVLRCNAPGQYRYAGVNLKRDDVTIENEDELYAKLPVGALKLEAELRRTGRLNVETLIVGMLEADRGDVQRTELEGNCDGATHVIAGVQVGAFRFTAGGEGEVAGGAAVGDAGVGVKRSTSKQMLGQDGDVDACRAATRADKTPPDSCGALLRLEVVALADDTKPPGGATCPGESTWDGLKCVSQAVSCPRGSRLTDGVCVAKRRRFGRSAEPEACATTLATTVTRGVHGAVQARLPQATRIIQEAVDFNKPTDVRPLELAPCRTTAMFGWFDRLVDGSETPEQMVYDAAFAATYASGERFVSDVTTNGRIVRGTYHYNGFHVYDDVPRKGSISLVMNDDGVYWMALETDTANWAQLAALFRASGESLTFVAP